MDDTDAGHSFLTLNCKKKDVYSVVFLDIVPAKALCWEQELVVSL